jgi:hypothetical protein
MRALYLPGYGDTAELNKRRGELEKERAEIAAGLEAVDIDEQTYRSAPAGEPVVLGAAESIRDRRLLLLVREIQLRERISVFDQECRQACRAKFHELNAVLESTREQVINGLVKIGYERPVAGVPTVITPGLVAAHPMVKSITAQISEAIGHASSMELEQRNREAVKELKETIKRIRERQLAPA